MGGVETDENLSWQLLIMAGIFAILASVQDGVMVGVAALGGFAAISASIAVAGEGYNRQFWKWLLEVTS